MKKLFLLFFSLCTLALSAQTGCEECFDEPILPVCTVDSFGSVIYLPNACLAECLGLTVVDCDTVDIDFPPLCDCEYDPSEEPICVQDPTTGDQYYYLSLCFAECEGYTAADIVECDSYHDIDSTFVACILECETSGTTDSIVCVSDSLGYEFPVSLCVAECLELDIVECSDNPWGNGCDCPYDPSDEPVCVADSAFNSSLYFGSLCLAECAGYTAEDVVDCNVGIDSVLLACFAECGTTGTYDSIVCVVDSSGIEFPLSLCVAECLSFEIIDCDFSDNPWGSDCDCDVDPTQEWICVLTDTVTGLICAFPNLCFAECEGYTADDVVECVDFSVEDSTWFDIDTMIFACLVECIDSTDWDAEDVVCVQFTDDEVIALPNACIAECLGYTIVDCEDGIRQENPVMQVLEGESLEQRSALTSYPNPATDRVVIVLDTDYDSDAHIHVRSLAGPVSQTISSSVSTGKNTISLDLTGLATGHYSVLIVTDQEVIEHRIVKQ